MFAYCNNNPIMCVDYSGNSCLFVFLVFGGCALIGGILGACTNINLAKTATEKSVEKSKKEQITIPLLDKNNIIEQNNSQSNNNASKKANSDMIQQKELPDLTVGERISNALIGASLGIAVGGAVVAVVAAGAAIVSVTPHVVIPLFGMSSAKAFAWGAIAFDSISMVVLPFFGIVGETIEYSESK